jgi:hypothetical protein
MGHFFLDMAIYLYIKGVCMHDQCNLSPETLAIPIGVGLTVAKTKTGP